MIDPAKTGTSLQLIAAPAIEKRILVVRKRQVMLDEDLADLYGVETRALVQQVRRNTKRFPEDFMFQLSTEEFNDLKSQSVMASGQHGGRRTRPLVFTEQGVAMLSGDEQLRQIFESLRQLISPPPRPKRPVGFGLPEDEE
jgi:hypothetical protein